jgi:hypothetical protein
MGSLMEELRRREAAARAGADRLRSRIEELAEELARAEEQVSRLVIAREEVTRLLEGSAVADPPAGQQAGGFAGEPRRASPTGAVTVPPWQDGAEASALPRAYQDLLEVAADAGRPLRAGEFAAAAGPAAHKAKVEGLRSKLKLLAARGWLAGVPGGLAVPPLRPGPPSRLADRDRDHRGSMPAPHRRPPRYRRGQMGPGRRRSRPHPPRGHQQRRLRGVLALPSRLRTPAALSRHRAGPAHARCLTGQLTPNELHPKAKPDDPLVVW